MGNEWTRIGSVKDGSIVTVGNGFFAFIKVCDHNGHGGIVNLFDGELLYPSDVEKLWGSDYCRVLADGLDAYLNMYNKDDE